MSLYNRIRNVAFAAAPALAMTGCVATNYDDAGQLSGITGGRQGDGRLDRGVLRQVETMNDRADESLGRSTLYGGTAWSPRLTDASSQELYGMSASRVKRRTDELERIIGLADKYSVFGDIPLTVVEGGQKTTYNLDITPIAINGSVSSQQQAESLDGLHKADKLLEQQDGVAGIYNLRLNEYGGVGTIIAFAQSPELTAFYLNHDRVKTPRWTSDRAQQYLNVQPSTRPIIDGSGADVSGPTRGGVLGGASALISPDEKLAVGLITGISVPVQYGLPGVDGLQQHYVVGRQPGQSGQAFVGSVLAQQEARLAKLGYHVTDATVWEVPAWKGTSYNPATLVFMVSNDRGAEQTGIESSVVDTTGDVRMAGTLEDGVQLTPQLSLHTNNAGEKVIYAAFGYVDNAANTITNTTTGFEVGGPAGTPGVTILPP